MAKTFLLFATVISWHDGDTFHGFIDQGFERFFGTRDHPVRCRAALIDAPELNEPGGVDARDYAAMIAPPGEYQCVSYKPDNYGRPLVDLMLPVGPFSRVMLAAGYALPYQRKVPSDRST